MKYLGKVGLSGLLLAILVLVVALDFMLNAIVFERANEFSVRSEEADRMAEHLDISRRLISEAAPGDRPEIANALCTENFTVGWTLNPEREAASLELDSLRQQVIEAEPSLAQSGLRLHIESLADGGHITGSMLLSDSSVIIFETDVDGAWSFNAQRTLTLLLPTIILVLLGMLLVKITLRPLRRLVEASRRVGSHDVQHIEATGTYEVREMVDAFNTMQDRIHQLIRNRQIAVSAIAHDLRTPLSRLQMRLEDMLGEDAVEAEQISADLAEMKMLLQSLQDFNQGLDHMGQVERIDVAIMLQTIIDSASDRGYSTKYNGPVNMRLMASPMALRRVLNNLVENAVHYAGDVCASLVPHDDKVEIHIDDNGPGIPDTELGEVLQPFVRLDSSRPRDTPGMGLGLAIVDQIVSSQGGHFTLANREEGGLRATITLPRTDA